MIALWGWGELNSLMIFGQVRDTRWAIAASLAVIAAIVLVHVAATVWSLRHPACRCNGCSARSSSASGC